MQDDLDLRFKDALSRDPMMMRREADALRAQYIGAFFSNLSAKLGDFLASLYVERRRFAR